MTNAPLDALRHMDTPERDAARAECAKAYYAAQEADKRFQEALIAAFGKQAGDMRYQPEKQTPEIRALGTLFQIASEEWRKAFNATPA